MLCHTHIVESGLPILWCVPAHDAPFVVGGLLPNGAHKSSRGHAERRPGERPGTDKILVSSDIEQIGMVTAIAPCCELFAAGREHHDRRVKSATRHLTARFTLRQGVKMRHTFMSIQRAYSTY